MRNNPSAPAPLSGPKAQIRAQPGSAETQEARGAWAATLSLFPAGGTGSFCLPRNLSKPGGQVLKYQLTGSPTQVRFGTSREGREPVRGITRAGVGCCVVTNTLSGSGHLTNEKPRQDLNPGLLTPGPVPTPSSDPLILMSDAQPWWWGLGVVSRLTSVLRWKRLTGAVGVKHPPAPRACNTASWEQREIAGSSPFPSCFIRG